MAGCFGASAADVGLTYLPGHSSTKARAAQSFQAVSSLAAISGCSADQIVLLGAVGLEIVQLPRAAPFLHELPAAVAHGFIPFVLPKDWLGAVERLPREGRQQAHAFHRQDRVSLEFGRVFRTGEFDEPWP